MSAVWCDRRGVIGITPRVPPGMLRLGCGQEQVLRETIEGFARLAYDNETWLVPGVPEADTADAALEAARRFREGLRRRLARRARDGAP